MNQFNGHERDAGILANAAYRREFLRGKYPDFFNGSSIDLGINKMIGIDIAEINRLRNLPVDAAYVPLADFKLP